MNKHPFLKVVVFFCLIGFSFSVALCSEQKVRVIKKDAELKILPQVESTTIAGLPLGGEFLIEERISEEWIKISLPPNKDGIVQSGYVQVSFVQFLNLQEESRESKDTKLVQENVPKKTNINFKLGGGPFSGKGYNFSHSWTQSLETASLTDSIPDASGFSYFGGIGLFVIPNLEITADYSSASSTVNGEYSISIPNPLYYTTIATATGQKSVNYKLSNWSIGLNYYFQISNSGASFYIGTGVAGAGLSLDMLQDINYSQTYSIYVNQVTITSITLKTTNLSKVGIMVRGGFSYRIGSNFGLFVEGKYAPANASVSHGLFTSETVSLDFGGFRFIGGVRIFI